MSHFQPPEHQAFRTRYTFRERRPLCRQSKPVPCLLLLLLVSAPLLAGTDGGAVAGSWSSPLQDLTYVHIEKRGRADAQPECLGCPLKGSEALEALPLDLLQKAGANALDSEGFLDTYLPEAAAQDLAEAARRDGLPVALGIAREIRLPCHTFTPGKSEGRDDAEVASVVPPRAIPNMFLAQFAYPIQTAWLDALDTCGIPRLAYLQTRTFLLRAPTLAAITDCPAARYLSWIEPYRASDRVAPALLKETNPLGYWLQFAAGTNLVIKARRLPPGMTVQGSWAPEQDHVAYLRVQSNLTDLATVATWDADLLSIAGQSDAATSDERQGQIVSGNHFATSVCTNLATCPYPRYRTWLNSRGLLGAANQQTVAIVDKGYDDGGGPTPGVIDHHPDLESPERLAGLTGVNPASWLGDNAGHPTMTAGIIVGDGSVAGASGAKDSGGYYNGSGIAPGAKIFMYAITDFLSTSEHQSALNFSRNRMESDLADRAFIANESWNENDPRSGVYLPVPGYTLLAQFFDARVVDANTSVAGDQPMAIVFSAGNFAFNCLTQAINWDSVSSPASAKNVIAVGASESYRPAPDPPLACRGCFDSVGAPNGRPPDHDATNINAVANFSGRGRYFGPLPNTALANNTRIKPDCVAPGVRIFSVVPYMVPQYDSITRTPTGCVKYYPASPNTYHTYGSGTSFAAPVVSGLAALARKWFLDHGVSPSPSLIKAALIDTADDLGGATNGNDHRPSPLYGWGRVNIDRFSDSVSKMYYSASSTNAVGTGQTLTYTLHVSSATSPILITLVWDDPPSDIQTTSQAPLKNDLQLDVGDGAFRGNFFNENMTGIDDGWSYRFNVGVPANDSTNNVEAVFIPAGTFPVGTVLRLKVAGSNVPAGSSAGRQPFSLYAYNMY